ncbi:asparagine--tRNA ligase [Candidatus Mycoplasma pogonae]
MSDKTSNIKSDLTIREILLNAEKFNETNVEFRAWVAFNRGNAAIRFLNINDGTTVENLQVVLKAESIHLEEVAEARMGAAVYVSGQLKLTLNMPQPIEMTATVFKLLRNTDLDFPIQKKEITLETLRDLPHLRHRTSLIKAAMLIRSTLFQELHAFFQKKNYLLMSSPLITSNDGEGAGETFEVITSERDFFGKDIKATLGVTGQLHAESYAIGFGKVYTFGPAFRAENSHTKKHASEFWMLEPEVAFFELKDVIKLADEMLKTVIRKTLEINKLEFDYLESKVEPELRQKLQLFLDNELQYIEYKDAIIKLAEVKERFEEQNIHFGMDLGTEHERYLAEELFKGPVAVINYPKEFKAFYMYQNQDGQTVAAFDLLVPGIGELIGGSQREASYDKLLQRIEELNLPAEELQWYLDLRRFGDSGSAGFGLGFERFVMYVTGINNIRDVIPFPRTPNNLKM